MSLCYFDFKAKSFWCTWILWLWEIELFWWEWYIVVIFRTSSHIIIGSIKSSHFMTECEKKCGEKLINSFLHVPSSSTRRPNNVLYMHVCVYKFLVGVQANIENIFENLSKIVKLFQQKRYSKIIKVYLFWSHESWFVTCGRRSLHPYFSRQTHFLPKRTLHSSFPII